MMGAMSVINSRCFEVGSWTASDISDEYDLAIATLGYETRSSHLWKYLKPRARYRVALGFAENEVLSFGDNLRYYEQKAFEVFRPQDSGFLDMVEAALNRVDAPSES